MRTIVAALIVGAAIVAGAVVVSEREPQTKTVTVEAEGSLGLD